MATSSVSSSLGVGSGLDLTTLLEGLREASEAKLTLLANKQTQQESRLSAYSSIKSAVESLQTAAKALQVDGLFQSTTATTTSTAFTATSTSDAAAGSYSIAVSQLAQAHSLYTSSSTITDSATEIGSGGTITFTLGNGDTKTLELEGDVTLESLAAAINVDSDLGVNATLVNTGSSVRLMLTASDTGTDAAIASISVADNSELEALIGYSETDSANFTVGTEAQNALLTINGLEIESQSNTIEDAVDGITLTLAETTTSAATLTIASDTSSIATAIQTFVTAYNNVQSVIKQATAFDVEEETQAALTGDYTARSIANAYRQALQVTGTGSVLQSLADLGITTETSGDNQGLLTIDSTALTEALEDNPDDVAALFEGDSGIAANVANLSTQQLASDGLFANLEDSIDSAIERLEKQQESMSARIDAEMAVYQARFVALDAYVAEMSSLSSYLTTQLASLTSSSSSS
ncbi:MAG: flagellar filament capping protein FliD [Comamonas sp.]